MSGDLGEFFSLIGKAKKEKEDEFRSLVGDLDIDSMFSQVKVSIEEDNKKKKKEEKQIKALESWLFTEPKKKEEVETIEVTESPIVDEDETNYEEWIEEEVKEREEAEAEEEKTEEVTEEVEDTVDHALKILETIKSKEEVRENLGDPEILKIRRELEYLKNLVNAQGGGEVRLEFLDDVDRTTAKTDGYVLQYQASTGKWIGAVGGGGVVGSAGTWGVDSVGINTVKNVGIGTTAKDGYKLYVEGDARVTGILTVGPASVTIDGINNRLTSESFVGNLTGSASNVGGVSSTFLLNYNNFTNTPTIPSDIGDLTNSVGFVTSGIVVGYATEGYVNNLVAISTFSGDYNNLTNQPSIPSIVGLASEGYVDAAVSGVSIPLSALTDVNTSNLSGISTDYLMVYDPSIPGFKFVNPKTYFGINNDANPAPDIVDYGVY